MKEEKQQSPKEALICKFIERKTRVKILTKSNGFYNGYILVLGDNSILIRDKFDKEMVLDLDFIKSIEEGEK